MLDAASQRIVHQVVRDWVQQARMFTASDVASEARRRGARAIDTDVRDLLQAMFQPGLVGATYTWTAIDVSGPEKVQLFHRLGDDPWQYDPSANSGPSGFLQWIWSALFGPPAPEIEYSRPPTSPPRATQPILQPSVRQQTAQPAAPAPKRPTEKKLNLDAAQFLPISRAELKDAASKTRLWGSPWFGRRDLIPPVEDERTKLIDRALVSHGMLSPEQLVEIHRVGAEMDLVRPDLVAEHQQTAKAGSDAVAEDRAARAAVKAKKKEEAARKKERQRAEIAHRRETDIIFLGRGVSGRLGERTSDVEKLQSLGLPVLATPADLATALSLSISQLRWLAFHTDVATRTHYVHFTIPKRSGGLRTLSRPHKRLAATQKWILRNILARLPVEPNAHGFVAGRSILTNARGHVGRAVVVNLDLENFFPTIAFPRVRSVFQRCGYSPAVATILALLCTESPRKQVQFAGQTYFVATGPRALPQGACTSPALSNQVARRLDKRLQGIATKLASSYTRYADDLTFSGSDELLPRIGYLLARIRHIAQDEGFAVNEAKSRILRRSTQQQVTGLVVNQRPGVPRKEVRRLRAILHGARKTGLAAQNREGRSNFSSWLQGMISFVAMSQPELGAKMKAELQAVLSAENK